MPDDIQKYDAETVHVGVVELGGPVDLPRDQRTAYATITGLRDADRRPIVPAWVRSTNQRREVTVAAAKHAGHHAIYHVTRSPKYLAKVAVYSPIGVARGLGKLLAWSFNVESRDLRVAAVIAKDHGAFETHSARHDRRVSARTKIVLPGLLLLLVAVFVFVRLAPTWWTVLAAFAVSLPLAWYGRPADKPITDRVVISQGFTRLTADQVRTAVVSLGMSRVKDPGDITFPPPGIHKDGPGFLARFDLPHGLEAIDVIKRRGSLASGLRMPLDQVWPGKGPEHEGQVDLWVAQTPVSKMPAPRWPLATSKAQVDVFAGYPIGYNERLRSISFTPFERNILIGGQPGSGKTFAGRAIVLGALLDPLTEMWIGAYKAAEDFYDVSKYCTRYFCGIDDMAIKDGEQMVADGLAEVQRRQTLLGKLKREGKITEGRTNRELAAAGIGLHPLFLVFDEVHELFLASKEAAEGIIRLTKQGRSAGVMGVLLTQVASKDSVPPELTRVISSRWCLSVLDYVANDQIMGTGAYKRGLTGTVYRPGEDAGWGVTTGIADGYSGAARGYYPNAADLATMLKRIAVVRAGSQFSTTTDSVPRGDVLADVRRVFYAGEAFVSWKQITARLADTFPERYSGIGQDAVSALVRDADDDIPSWDGKDKGTRTTLKGLRLEHLSDALQRREIGGSK